jgi:hypothetical protein
MQDATAVRIYSAQPQTDRNTGAPRVQVYRKYRLMKRGIFLAAPLNGLDDGFFQGAPATRAFDEFFQTGQAQAALRRFF